MLSLDAFLTRILPSTGDIVVVQLTGSPPVSVHYAFASIPQAVAKIRALEQIRANIYIAMAGFKPGSVKTRKGRSQENAERLRALWLDLDVGPEAGKYPTQRDAATALKAFIETTGLPAPLVVGSGGGLHVYWPFDTDVDQTTWKPLALALKNLCVKHGLKIDMRCTADAARILRPVETTNWKTGNARLVRVKIDAVATPVDELRPLLGLNGIDTLQHIRHTGINGNAYGLGAIDIADPEQFDGQKILDGCKQMQWAMHNADDVPEPMWREMVGTLYKSNAPHLIHTLSQGHAAYDHAETEAKGRLWKGRGATCKSLETEHPGGCIGCPHLGIIKSPSSIGFIVVPPPEVHIDPITSMPQNWFHQDNMLWMHTDDGPSRIYSGTIEIGMPFMDRNSFGVSRMLAPVATIVNGARTEGYVDYATTGSPSELHKALTSCGIIFEQRHHKSAMNNIRAWLQDARSKAVVAPAQRQLGWDSTKMYEHDSAYVLGDTIYRPDGTQFVTRLSEDIQQFGKDLRPNGSMQEWQRAFNLLGLPGYEAHMVMSWIGFGAPLIRLATESAAMVHAYSQETGQGKTTVLRLINSIYGDPASASLSWSANATPNAIQTAMSLLNGVPMGIDEISRLEPDAQHKLLYECTDQTGRKRLKQNGVLPPPLMTRTMMFSTGNTSLRDVASTLQMDASPLQARLIEFPLTFPAMTPDEQIERQTIAESIKSNFGHAAPKFIQYLVEHQKKVPGWLHVTRLKLIQAAQVDYSDERFRITSLVSMITGASIAKRLGLIDHPIERGVEWIIDWFGKQREVQEKAGDTPTAILERMLGAFYPFMVVVDRDTPVNIGSNAPGTIKTVTAVKRPLRDDLQGRFAKEERRVYINTVKVKEWLVDNRLNVTGMLDKWRDMQLLVDTAQCVLGKWTYEHDLMLRPTCYIFDLSKRDDLADVLTP
jgi:hypothetical protein